MSVSWFAWSVPTHSTLFDPDPSLGLVGRHCLPSLLALSYHALYRPLCAVVLLSNSPPLRSSLARRYANNLSSAVSFCRTTFEFIFSQRLLTLPLLAATCRVCRVEPCLAFVDSPAIIIIPLCTTPLPLLVFSFFLSSSFGLKCCYHYHYHRHHHHHDYDYYLMLVFSFYIVTVAVVQHVGQTLKKRSQSPNKRKLLLFE